MPETVSSPMPAAPALPVTMPTPGIMPAPKPKDHKVIMVIVLLLLALGLIAGAAVIGYILGQNNAPKSPTTTTSDTPAAPPAQTPAEVPPAASTVKTYSNADYRDAGFKYDTAKWTLTEQDKSTQNIKEDMITLASVSDPSQKISITLTQGSVGMYTGNVAYFCGSESKIIKSGEIVSHTSPDGSDYLKSGVVRVRVDKGTYANTSFYGGNYFTVSDYDYLYDYQNTVKIPVGLCTDNGGVVSATDTTGANPNITAPQGTLTRIMVSIENSQNWSAAQLAEADMVVASSTISK